MPGTGAPPCRHGGGFDESTASSCLSGQAASVRDAITWVAVVAAIAAIPYWIMMAEPKACRLGMRGQADVARGHL